MSRLLRVSLVVFVVLLMAMLIFSRQDARPVDGYLTVGFPLTFYRVLQNMGCLGPPLPDGTCCVDLCPPEFALGSLMVDIVVVYVTSLLLATGYHLASRSRPRPTGNAN